MIRFLKNLVLIPHGNSNVDSETDSHNLTQNANADYELSDSMKQFYHDLGID